ncbi:MAG: hypothetical protein KAT04_12970 [Methylococcales bacterium]|nr:hypothetical protein [Methylococcales bacterium]
MNKPIEISISMKFDGIKADLSVEIYPETIQLLHEPLLSRSSSGKTFSDLMEEELCPILNDLTPQLLQVHHIASGNLLKAFFESSKVE